MNEDIYFHEEYKMWWPKFDHKPAGNHHMIKGGIGAIGKVLKYCKKTHTCIQAGGHLGYWPLELSRHFQIVHTFEPDPILFRCLSSNVKVNSNNIIPYCLALGNSNQDLQMRRGSSAGSTKVYPGGKLTIPQIKLDDTFVNCDALVLDIEGYEIEALQGAAELIQDTKPVILCEELRNNKEALHSYMESIGYILKERYGKDGIWISK